MTQRRDERVNSALRRIISEALVRDVRDPRIGFVTINRAEIHEDYRHCTVYFTVLENQKREKTLKLLNEMRGLFQGAVAKHLRLRNTPFVEFVLDDTVDRNFYMEKLFKEAQEKDAKIVKDSSKADASISSPPNELNHEDDELNQKDSLDELDQDHTEEEIREFEEAQDDEDSETDLLNADLSPEKSESDKNS